MRQNRMEANCSRAFTRCTRDWYSWSRSASCWRRCCTACCTSFTGIKTRNSKVRIPSSIMKKTWFVSCFLRVFVLLAGFPAAAVGQALGVTELGAFNGGTASSARAISGDSSVVVGSASDGAAGGQFRAFRWTQAGGMVSLGVLNGGLQSYAGAVNSDGSVIVGEASDGAAGNVSRAFRWTQAGG